MSSAQSHPSSRCQKRSGDVPSQERRLPYYSPSWPTIVHKHSSSSIAGPVDLGRSSMSKGRRSEKHMSEVAEPIAPPRVVEVLPPSDPPSIIGAEDPVWTRSYPRELLPLSPGSLERRSSRAPYTARPTLKSRVTRQPMGPPPNPLRPLPFHQHHFPSEHSQRTSLLSSAIERQRSHLENCYLTGSPPPGLVGKREHDEVSSEALFDTAASFHFAPPSNTYPPPLAEIHANHVDSPLFAPIVSFRYSPAPSLTHPVFSSPKVSYRPQRDLDGLLKQIEQEIREPITQAFGTHRSTRQRQAGDIQYLTPRVDVTEHRSPANADQPIKAPAPMDRHARSVILSRTDVPFRFSPSMYPEQGFSTPGPQDHLACCMPYSPTSNRLSSDPSHDQLGGSRRPLFSPSTLDQNCPLRGVDKLEVQPYDSIRADWEKSWSEARYGN